MKLKKVLFTAVVLMLLCMSASLAETYYIKYNMKVYSYPSAEETVLGVLPQQHEVKLLGWTNDKWREVRATVNGSELHGWIYSPTNAEWSTVDLTNEKVWSQYLSDTSVHDATGYNMSLHYMQIIDYNDGRPKVSSSGGLLGTDELSRVAVPKGDQPVSVHARNSASSAVVYTLASDEAFRMLRYAGDYDHMVNEGYMFIETQTGSAALFTTATLPMKSPTKHTARWKPITPRRAMRSCISTPPRPLASRPCAAPAKRSACRANITMNGCTSARKASSAAAGCCAAS